jgi:hypothetical protein
MVCFEGIVLMALSNMIKPSEIKEEKVYYRKQQTRALNRKATTGLK